VFIFNTHFVWAGSVMSVLLQLAGVKGLMGFGTSSRMKHRDQDHIPLLINVVSWIDASLIDAQRFESHMQVNVGGLY